MCMCMYRVCIWYVLCTCVLFCMCAHFMHRYVNVWYRVEKAQNSQKSGTTVGGGAAGLCQKTRHYNPDLRAGESSRS